MAFELFEDLVVTLAHQVGKNVEAAAMGHAHHRRIESGVDCARQDRVENWDCRLGAFEAETLGAHILRSEELFEGLGSVETIEDAALFYLRDGELHAFDLALNPALLFGVLDVHVLDADGAAIRIAQHAEQFAERLLFDAADAAREELALKVPDGESIGSRVEFDRHLGLLPTQRIEVGDEVPTHAMHADQRCHLHLLVQHCVFAVARVDVGAPLHCFVRHAEIAEHALVEAVLAHQQFVHPLEEHAAFGALNDAVVVGARDGHDLAHTERAESALIAALELGRVIDAANANDDALARHQARHALHGADGAWVRERDGGALEIGDGELVRLDLTNDLFVGGEELFEVERACFAQHWHHQGAAAIGLGDIDSETHLHSAVTNDARLAIGVDRIAVVHLRYGVADSAGDGVTDEMGEADLALANASAVAVDHLAVDLEQLGGHIAEAGCRWHREAAFHVGRNGCAGTAKCFANIDSAGRCGNRCGHWRCGNCRHHGCCGSKRGRRCGRSRGTKACGCVGGGTGLVIREELLPCLANCAGIGSVLLVHFVDQPRVRAERLTRFLFR